MTPDDDSRRAAAADRAGAPADTVFDGIATAFETEIYGSTKGEIRLQVLWADLLATVDGLTNGRLRILDAGGGAGHLAVRFAELGHDVVLAEPSGEMLDRAGAAVRDAGVESRVRLVQTTIQDLPTPIDGTFDLVTCHAVLEWVAHPADVIAALVPFVGLQGALSLLFYNRNARLVKDVLAGEPLAAERWAGAGDGGQAGATTARGWPHGARPLAEQDVRAWLRREGFGVTSRAGIRIFHDLLAPGLRTPERMAALVQAELAFRAVEPFASLAQHMHLVARRTAPTGRAGPAIGAKFAAASAR